MTGPKTLKLKLQSFLAVSLGVGSSLAQQGPAPNAPPPETIPVPTENGEVMVVPGATSTTTTTQVYVPPPGYPAPGVDINPGLPSSSRPTSNTSIPSDSFDLNSSSSPAVVRGERGGEGIILGGEKPLAAPSLHTVRPGDTLWDLCGRYYGNPYNWPRVWSYNAQIENPHWIYPGDQVRMRQGATAGQASAGGEDGAGGFIDRRAAVPGNTVFLRTQGFIGDPKRDLWGEVVGAREDQMLLSEGNHAYVAIRPGVEVRLGQKFTIFRARDEKLEVRDARRPPGEIVTIKGTFRVDQWDPKNRIARGKIVESVDVIERGAKVGPVTRRLEVVSVRPNRAELLAHVLTSVYPHVHYGQNQVVFLDRGAQDGLEPGNRLLVVRKGDSWRQSLLLPARVARERPVIDSTKYGVIETTPPRPDEKNFPEEVIAELRVLRAERYSSLALVTASSREITAGDRAVAKRGY